MPKKEKETHTCHECGLEDLEACEGHEELSDDKMSMHRSARPSQSPCAFCIRNTEITQSPSFTDFWHE
jgi:hypothetical protein